MALSIIQAGSSLQALDASGVLTTLSLPTNITLRSDVPPRWAVYRGNVVLVNTSSQPLTIGADGVIRLLCPKPPRNAPILTGPNAGALTGTYRAKMTHVIQDAAGNLLAESDYSPISAPVTITSKKLLASNLDISPDQITGHRLYRTTTAGAVYFQWVDLDGNVLTSVQDDLADAALSLVSAPILGTPPRLVLISEFRGRLFGVGDQDLDTVLYTEAGIQYAWPDDNSILVPGVGMDRFGVTAFAARRDALGVGRRNMLVQIIGSGVEDATGLVDFSTVVISKEVGIESQESVKVFRDTAYFLWQDGVYAWDGRGVRCVSDDKVRSWFATDDYFNRDRYQYAFSEIDPARPCYRLFLCSAGSTTVDSWVEFNIDDQTWWGPHSTALFTPSAAFNRTTLANRIVPVIGGGTAVYQEQTTRTDGASTAIAFDVLTKRFDVGEPDVDKFFGELSIFGQTQAAGALTVTAHVGAVDATASNTQTYTMTSSRQRLGRLGVGKHAQIELSQAVAGVDVELFGFDINPVNLFGRR